MTTIQTTTAPEVISEFAFYAYMDEINYPCIVNLGEDSKGELTPQVFYIDEFNRELCQPTGRMKALSSESIDRSYEYVDSKGNLLYGPKIGFLIEKGIAWLLINETYTGIYEANGNTELIQEWVNSESVDAIFEAFQRKQDDENNYALEFYLYGYNAPSWHETI